MTPDMTPRVTEESPENLVPRREIVKSALLSVFVVPVATFCAGHKAYAALVPLDEKDPQAKALGYLADASKVDAKTNATYKPGQTCLNCVQLTGNVGDAARSCNLFPGKTVNAKGWCKAWAKKS